MWLASSQQRSDAFSALPSDLRRPSRAQHQFNSSSEIYIQLSGGLLLYGCAGLIESNSAVLTWLQQLQGEIRNALEYMGPKYTALLQMGVENSSQMHSRPPPSTDMIRQGLVRATYSAQYLALEDVINAWHQTWPLMSLMKLNEPSTG